VVQKSPQVTARTHGLLAELFLLEKWRRSLIKKTLFTLLSWNHGFIQAHLGSNSTFFFFGMKLLLGMKSNFQALRSPIVAKYPVGDQLFSNMVHFQDIWRAHLRSWSIHFHSSSFSLSHGYTVHAFIFFLVLQKSQKCHCDSTVD
jgi:hypothetical protein